MRLICGACGFGFEPLNLSCPWCGASSHRATPLSITSVCDVECYENYFLAKFDTGEYFEMWEGLPLDIQALRQTLSKYTVITFNGNGYDMCIIALALAGRDNATLKLATSMIIESRIKTWEVLRSYNVQYLWWVDHIDMIEVAPGQASLKAYGGKMHCKTIQDLPIEHDTIIHPEQRQLLRDYCDNDLSTTRELFNKFQTQLKLREDMSVEYGVDLRSKSDAQIAEAVMKKTLPFEVKRPGWTAGETRFYTPPVWAKFVNLDVLDRICSLPFYISPTASVVPHRDQHLIDWGDKSVRVSACGEWIRKPKGWVNELITMGGTTYKMGTGGLHSTESSVNHVADDVTLIQDWDVASYYPSLILGTGIYPDQIGETFSGIYRTWFDQRLKAKRKASQLKKEIKETCDAEIIQAKKIELKKCSGESDSKKIELNGTFGKLGSQYSIFFAPFQLLQVTLTGQIAILMLIEMMELATISVVSANTDGIVLKFHPDKQWLVNSVVAWWEGTTGFEMERTDYSGIYARDVNSYIAVKTDGGVKLKGAFSPDMPSNPTGQICVTAMVEYIQHGTPIEQTIYGCRDVREFVYVRTVDGGGVLNNRPVIPKKPTKKIRNELLEKYGFKDYEWLIEWSQGNTEYLGKVVRWYYGAGSEAHIQYKKSGNMVPRTTGCKPCMTLSDVLPIDIDYDWYINETLSLLKDVDVFVNSV